MIYITGDTHGDFNRYKNFAKLAEPTENDIVIVVGDACLNYSCDEKDENRKKFISTFPFQTFCIHGNHELRPEHMSEYELVNYHAGYAWQEDEFPKIFFGRDGDIYDFEGKSTVVIGGAYSVDKYFRLEKGYRWFDDEQPSEEIKARVEQKLSDANWKVDVVLSHTCPRKYEPTDVFIKDLDQSTVDKSTEDWLDYIEDRLTYRTWYCGHFHINRELKTKEGKSKVKFLYDDFAIL